MPNLPLLKLCLTCDQISTLRGRSRKPRCSAPVPPEGRPCRSRSVRLITVRDLNLERLLFRQEVTGLHTRLANLEARHDELAEVVADLRETRRR